MDSVYEVNMVVTCTYQVQEIDRKIIFVCHSLGGLVVKQALILNAHSILKPIQDCTAGIIFLGTPHGGSHLGRTLTLISLLTGITGSSQNFAKVLSTNSESLHKLNDGFKDYYMKRLRDENGVAPLKISSFAELQRTPVANSPIHVTVVPIKSSLTHLEDEIPNLVDKDHHTICRFASPDDPVFEMIWKLIAEWMGSSTLALARSPTFEHGEHIPNKASLQYLFF
jgi:hypothetical protein